MEKSFLFILTRAPYQGAGWRDALDALLATSAFGQPVRVLLTGAAVLQLLPNQQPSTAAMKAPLKHYESFPLYDIDTIYVAADALQRYALQAQQLAVPVSVLDTAGLRELLGAHDRCLTF